MKIVSHLKEILGGWGIKTMVDWLAIQDDVFRVTLSDGKQFVLKDLGLRNEATIQRLQFEYDVLHYVEQRGLAVAVPLLAAEGTPYVIYADHIYRLSRWLPNQPAKAQTSEERSRLYQSYGAAIARFHLALASYKDEDSLGRTWETDLKTRVFDEAVPVIFAHLDQAQLLSFKALLAEIEPEMRTAYANLSVQPIIWDCHPGNVAVDGFEVSGFIDCDHISIAPRIFDLADFLVHLIKWDVGDEQKAALWLAHFQQLIRGYESVTLLSKHECAALFYVMVSVLLIFMAFFFQSGRPELTKVELETFDWLVRHRQEIITQFEN